MMGQEANHPSRIDLLINFQGILLLQPEQIEKINRPSKSQSKAMGTT